MVMKDQRMMLECWRWHYGKGNSWGSLNVGLLACPPWWCALTEGGKREKLNLKLKRVVWGCGAAQGGLNDLYISLAILLLSYEPHLELYVNVTIHKAYMIIFFRGVIKKDSYHFLNTHKLSFSQVTLFTRAFRKISRGAIVYDMWLIVASLLLLIVYV